MDNLKALGQEVNERIAILDGSWQSQKALLDSIETLRIAAMGPADYVSGLRYQVRHLWPDCFLVDTLYTNRLSSHYRTPPS